MERTVKLGNKEITLKASALLPRLYRSALGRDLIVDMTKLQKSLEKNNNEIDEISLEIFENLAWCMAYHYDNTLPKTPDEWLGSLDGVFDIYSILPDILELWAYNNATTSKPIKKA